MAQIEHVADRVGGRQRHCRGADDAGVEQRQREQHRGDLPGVPVEAEGDASGITERANFRMAGKGPCGDRHQRDGADRDEDNADPQIGALMRDEARGNSLVDDVALLKEQLPGCHGRADDGDDQRHHLTQSASLEAFLG
jgi:hypothetical protein